MDMKRNGMKYSALMGIALLSGAINAAPAQSRSLNHALKKATHALDKYLKHSSPLDEQHVFEYLHHYGSWYQAVTPAPQALVESLSSRAHLLVNRLKKYAQPFELIFDQPMPGRSRLSPEGRQYYEEVIQRFKHKIGKV